MKTHTMWALYNYNNLMGVFFTRRGAIKHYTDWIDRTVPWDKARRAGYMRVAKVNVTEAEK